MTKFEIGKKYVQHWSWSTDENEFWDVDAVLEVIDREELEYPQFGIVCTNIHTKLDSFVCTRNDGYEAVDWDLINSLFDLFQIKDEQCFVVEESFILDAYESAVDYTADELWINAKEVK